MLLSTLWTWITGKLNTLAKLDAIVTDATLARTDAGQTFAGAQVFSTRPTSSDATAPAATSLITLADAGVRTAQIINVEQTADFSTAALIPYDATIPQITEGTEYITAAITPANAGSTLEILVELSIGGSGGGMFIAALFQDATADAIQTAATPVSGGVIYSFIFRAVIPAASTTARTYRVRVGSNGVTAYVNRNSTPNMFGASLISRLSIREILP